MEMRMSMRFRKTEDPDEALQVEVEAYKHVFIF